MTDNINRLLIVDGEQTAVDFVTGVAAGMGFAVAQAEDPATLLSLVESFRPTVVLLDLQLPQGDGVEILRLLVARDCKADIILTSAADKRVVTATFDLGVSRGLSMSGTLAKPMVAQELSTKLASLLKQDRALGEADLELALERNELVAYFQPKASLVEAGGWRIDGVEALVRWQHPSLGLVMPDEFIPLAERTGQIAGLTEHVLDQALAHLRCWTDMGLELKCAVNVPPSLVTDLEFPDRIASLIAQYGLDGNQLALELTETATMQDPTRTMDILTRLRVKQIGLSLDDFGTGYSSLGYLRRFPVDILKIDRSFVSDIAVDPHQRQLVEAIITMGHSLGLRVVAEGVERPEQAALLKGLQCDMAQGYLFGRPAPMPALIAAEINPDQAQNL
jgi:EAL domain-containing protein (putative c-di-GMP-specific phosphodiesterase class I)/ActR/RegA family two-component response regulator